MIHDHPRFVMLRRMAWVCAFLVFSIVTLSASIRLSTLGLGCTPWPQCYAQMSSAGSTGIEVMRVMHRVSAVLLLPLLLVLVMGGFARKPEVWPQRWLAVLAVFIALFLAVLGRWTAGAKLPAIALGNLLGGFLLFAVCVRMALATRHETAVKPSSSAPAWRHWAVLATVVQVALGGLLSSGLAALSCPSLLACPLPDPMPWEVLNPWHLPQFEPGSVAPNPAGALLHWLHRAMAAAVMVTVLLTARALWRTGRHRAGIPLAALLLAQAALGLLLIATGLPLWAAVAHNALAALLLALLLALG